MPIYFIHRCMPPCALYRHASVLLHLFLSNPNCKSSDCEAERKEYLQLGVQREKESSPSCPLAPRTPQGLSNKQ